ncbi:MAG: aminopeptidase, partial [Pseudobdellovibrio sp.]
TALFYLAKEGPDSKTLKLIHDENDDDALFSVFITKEIDLLKKWYDEFDLTKNIPSDEKEALRQRALSSY